MRVVKERLREMMPEVRVFLDTDESARSEKSANLQIDTSDAILCFCTEKFFESGPCMQEVVRGVLRGKPLLCLLEEVRPWTLDLGP